jgi:DNA-directed RNA polymerase beta' subunit
MSDSLWVFMCLEQQFMAGKAIVKKDRNGRVMKQGDDYRWTKDWFTQNILGKSGNCTARAVITGDPAIAVDEIAIPDAISRELTVPERVTKWNQKRLQDCVDRTQMLEVRRGTGATGLIRNGEFISLHATTTKQLEIGDLVNRHLQDGDYVYVNRPPSVHKHSLMALRVVLHPGMVIAINPFICPPFGADFDGDIFHIFVPQSVEAMVELKELMTVQQQIICSQGGLPLLGLTQDTLLAAHLMTSQKVFLDKVSMDQLQMWSSAAVVPEAAILKSPKGGPLWTGEQLYSLTLPAGVDFHTLDGEVLIRNGEILKTGFSSKWLQKGRNSLIDAICDQSGPEAVVEYLNSAKGLLHAWLDSNGFSTGLTDFLVTSNAEERQSMLQRVSVDCLQRAKEQSINTLQICDAKFQLSHLSVDLEVDGAFDRLEVNPASLSNKVQMLESIAIKAFRASMAGMGNIVQESSVSQNSLFSMVKAGSTKASMSKLLDQIACMGLQLYKGEHMLPFSRVLNNSAPLESQLQEWWEDHGLVQNSLVDGLTAFQLFNHVIANRTSILRKHVEVVQPGTLFKVLMLFLRDLHVGYDGTVRSQCGQKVVQFCYGGARARHRRSRKEDPDLRWKVSYLAGEPVGVLAATALSQPAYESMLDAPHHSGWKIRPLELVQVSQTCGCD